MIGKMHQMYIHYVVWIDPLFSQVHILLLCHVYFVFLTRASDKKNVVLSVL